MAIPDTNNFGFENVSDLIIEGLLASNDPGERDLGLQALDAKKRVFFCKRLKAISHAHDWKLQREDIADFWQEMMLDILSNIEQGHFAPTGDLDGYVYTILKRRGIDFLRKRGVRAAINRGVDAAMVAVAQRDESNNPPPIEFDYLLLDYMKALSELKKLAKTEKLVIRHFVTRLLTTKKIPLPAELAASVNEQLASKNEDKLSVDAVQSAKTRAIKKLRGDRVGNQADQGDQP